MAAEEDPKLKSSKSKDKKKDKRSETDGVSKPKKDKKEKKAEKEKLKQKVANALDQQLQEDVAAKASDRSEDASVAEEKSSNSNKEQDVKAKKEKKKEAKDDDNDNEEEDDHPGSDFEDIKNPGIVKNMVYFALPLADAKGHKKIYKAIKKARHAGALQRGVKEVNKALRKTPLKTPSATTSQIPGVAIIAGDISPAEVIMHLPLYCEEHNIPYLFVNSRLDLGTAARTKRPTSVVFVTEKGKAPKQKQKQKKDTENNNDNKKGGDESEDDDGAGFEEAYQGLLKMAQKEYAKQMKDILRG